MGRALCCALALALIACERPPAAAGGTPDSASRPSAAAPAGDTIPRLTSEGWGSLRIGMTRAEVVAAAGDDANPQAVGGPDPERCDEFRPARAPRGLLVMLERGRLTRVSLGAGAPVASEGGIRVGDPVATVLAAHGGAAMRSPHKYVEAPGEYVTVRAANAPGGETRGVRYEVGADGRVSRIHAGGPSIEYVEGCL
jgi:hypothetical protein